MLYAEGTRLYSPKQLLVLFTVINLVRIVFITLHTCARGKAIGFVCLSVFISTKIARSGDLGGIARCKYHYSVRNVGKRTYFFLLSA